VPSFEEKHGLKGCIVAPTAIIRGVGLTFNMDVIESEGATGYYDSNLEGKFVKMAETLDTEGGYDFGFVHIKGVDDAGHDKCYKTKVEQIEKTDKAIVKMLEMLNESKTEFILCATGDHTTPVRFGDHSHEPVPLAFGTVR
jgi:2,3-diphosphopglycerate-independent phosphoglycerate mutase